MQNREPARPGVDNPVIVVDDGVEFEVVWSGSDALLPPRQTKPDLTWEPPRRLYNKKPVTVTVDAGASAPVEQK
jgi:hypothetical protein